MAWNNKIEKVGRKNPEIWDHKYSNLVHVDLNHTEYNQSIPDDLTNIGSIHDSYNICSIEKIL